MIKTKPKTPCSTIHIVIDGWEKPYDSSPCIQTWVSAGPIYLSFIVSGDKDHSKLLEQILPKSTEQVYPKGWVGSKNWIKGWQVLAFHEMQNIDFY